MVDREMGMALLLVLVVALVLSLLLLCVCIALLCTSGDPWAEDSMTDVKVMDEVFPEQFSQCPDSRQSSVSPAPFIDCKSTAEYMKAPSNIQINRMDRETAEALASDCLVRQSSSSSTSSIPVSDYSDSNVRVIASRRDFL